MNNDKLIKELTNLCFGKGYTGIPNKEIFNKVKEWKEHSRLLAVVKNIVSDVDMPYSDTIDSVENIIKSPETVEDSDLYINLKYNGVGSGDADINVATGNFLSVYLHNQNSHSALPSEVPKLVTCNLENVSAELREKRIANILDFYRSSRNHFKYIEIETTLKGKMKGKKGDRKRYNDDKVRYRYDIQFDYKTALEEATRGLLNFSENSNSPNLGQIIIDEIGNKVVKASRCYD